MRMPLHGTPEVDHVDQHERPPGRLDAQLHGVVTLAVEQHQPARRREGAVAVALERRQPHVGVARLQPGHRRLRRAHAGRHLGLRETLAIKRRQIEILAHHTGRSLGQVERDIERDHYLTAGETHEYGLIDEIIRPRRGVSAEVMELAGRID